MSTLERAFRYLNDPLNWRGSQGIPQLALEQLLITVVAVGVAALIALPLAFWLGHTGRGGGVVVALGNVTRAMPTLALLTIFATTAIGFGDRATTVALVVFALPPLLANAYTGIRGVDPEIVEAARGVGMAERDVLLRVEAPLALPLIAAGFRTAAVQVVATAPLAALVGGGTLGTIVTSGFGNLDPARVLVGGMLVALLALLVDAALGLVQRALTPGRSRRFRRRGRGRPAEAVPA